jgi:hypothetical protein
MNYKRFKKATIWLALTCVLALPVAMTFTPPVSAQGYHRRYDRRARYYYRDRWGRLRYVYRPRARSRHYRYRPRYFPRVRYYGYPPRYYRRRF